MLLTHAHIDHCGLIPKLHKEGFVGKIYTTPATRDICGIILEDSAQIQEKNTEEENRRRQRMNQPLRKPLFTQEDAQKCMPLFSIVEYTQSIKLNDQVEIRFVDAGHIMGSASIEVWVTEGDIVHGVGKKTKLVFSGDIGQRDTPIIQDPTLIADAEYLFMESTYGDRLHEDTAGKEELLLKYTLDTYKK